MPYVAETYTVTDQYLEENHDLLKAFLTRRSRAGATSSSESTDDTVELIAKYYDQAASDDAEGLETVFGALDPKKTGWASRRRRS